MSNESPSQSSLALPGATDADTQAPSTNEPSRSTFALSEDWIAVLLGGGLLMLCLAAVLIQGNGGEGWSSPLTPFLAKSGTWNWPFEAFSSAAFSSWIGIFGAGLFSLVTFAIATRLTGMSVKRFVPGFLCIFTLGTIAYACSTQVAVKSLNLEYALWALAIGLIISNTTGTPAWVRPAVRTELYIKTGLVLLGASVLFSKLLVLGLPGVCIAWIVTPIVLISTFWFGQKVLKIDSASLNMVISADMSVCGVSAAVATSAACKAKKEELSLAIGLSLMFTVVMMVVLPAVIQGLALNPILGGAWMGGTIDATGAVVAAGTALGDEGATVAATVKMIQNILIGVVAFGVAYYWTTRIENTDTRVENTNKSDKSERVSLIEIWKRFPKFILGFVAASFIFSIIYATSSSGPEIVNATVKGSTKTLRGWFFCLAFVSIGLDTNFWTLRKHLGRGKPVILYLVGQTLNLVLTFTMAYLMFEVFFQGATEELLR